MPIMAGGLWAAAAEATSRDDHVPPPPPAALSHLILSHPNSPEGKRDRSNRNHFQNCLTLLDECVDTDGTVKNLYNAAADSNSASGSSEKVLEALVEIGRRCRLGDRNEENSDDGGSEKNDKDSNPNNDANKSSNMNTLPYLAVFQRTSSIYTLMSFLSVLDPTKCAAETTTVSKENKNPTRLQILTATAHTLSSILSSNTTNNLTREDEKCAILRAELRDSFVPALGRLVCLMGGVVKTVISVQREQDATAAADALLVPLCCDLLQLGINATRGCEVAKVAFVQSALPSELVNALCNTPNATKRGGVAVLVACLSLKTSDDSSSSTTNNTQLLTEACQLLATLCRYDDFRDPSTTTSGAMGATGVTTSSAHDHAMEFHRAGAASLLIRIARGVLSKLEKKSLVEEERHLNSLVVAKERLSAAVLTALRVLAINDEIIQTMVALGMLPIVTQALQLGVTVTEPKNGVNARKQRLSAASLGLLRNLCGNDEIKTNLCLGSTKDHHSTLSPSSTPSILPHLLQSMRLFPSAALIQEHACGTLAAMALRRPANARAILDAGGPRWVLLAMRRHESNVNVQRQGALAVRNIVSRLLRDLPEEEGGGSGSAAGGGASVEQAASAVGGGGGGDERSSIRDAFLELGAEDVLRNISGRHQGSVDEAYAALRDLGCKVSLVKFNADDLQKKGQQPMMFGGKHNSNFRPVYEESAGLSDGVDDAVSKFGA
mmetsp:Transcript_17407/g.30632  ORF Transcript_17407/g.30632 Transcript_17407/m.30632 type:complete len:721 (-) Transcript_17407:238-2400(-)